MEIKHYFKDLDEHCVDGDQSVITLTGDEFDVFRKIMTRLVTVDKLREVSMTHDQIKIAINLAHLY